MDIKAARARLKASRENQYLRDREAKKRKSLYACRTCYLDECQKYRDRINKLEGEMQGLKAPLTQNANHFHTRPGQVKQWNANQKKIRKIQAEGNKVKPPCNIGSEYASKPVPKSMNGAATPAPFPWEMTPAGLSKKVVGQAFKSLSGAAKTFGKDYLTDKAVGGIVDNAF